LNAALEVTSNCLAHSSACFALQYVEIPLDPQPPKNAYHLCHFFTDKHI